MFSARRRASAGLIAIVTLGSIAAWNPVPVEAAEPPSAASTGGVSFAAHVAPLLQRHCVACHGPEKSKGHFRLDSFASLMKAGSSDKPTVLPGQPGSSHLYQLLIEKGAEDRMPQDADALPPAEIDLIRVWIAAGATFDGPSPNAPLISFLPKPGHPPAPASYSHAWPVTALAFDPRGGQVAVSGYREVTFWSVTNRTLLRRVGGMPERIRALAWQPGGNLLAVAGGAPGQSGEVLLVETSGNSPALDLAVAPDEMLCLAFSPDGLRLAAGGADKTVRVFAVQSGTETLRLEQHSDWVHGVAFSPDGRRFASASRDRTARVYNSTNGTIAAIFHGHDAAVECLAFTSDSQRILSSGADRVVRSWNAADGEQAKEFAKSETPITGMAQAGEWLFIALADGRVTQRRIPGREKVREFTGSGDRATALAFDPASQRLAVGSHDGRVRLWNLSDGGLILEFTASPGIATAGK